MLQTIFLLSLYSLSANGGVPFRLATPAPIGPNVALMEQLADAGLITRGPPLKTILSSSLPDPYDASSVKGVSYLPSNCGNGMAFWLNYNGALVRQELAYAAAATANVVRVPLHWTAWALNNNTFFSNLDDFVTAAAALNMRVYLTVFDAIGQDLQGDALGFASRGLANTTSGPIANPGQSQLGNSSILPTLMSYATALAKRYGSDKRVVGFDALFEPLLCAGDGPSCQTPSFLSAVSTLLLGIVDPTNAFVTTSIIPGAAACDSKNVPFPGRTVVAFENYNGNTGAVGGDGSGVQDCANSLSPSSPPPVILTAALGRLENPPSSVCETIFEAYGTPFINVPAHPRFGWVLPWLMIGFNSDTQDRPVPNKGLVWPNGTWFNDEEKICFSSNPPPFPPPPPGPPPPGVNFTTPDGLSVGLRNTTRAIQLLGLVDDTRWFNNFSFVPPLWNFIPSKPHRDFSGCHHIGDATFRVQPLSHTNASEWAFYSTATADDNDRAQPLPGPLGPGVYDASNLTAATSSGGQDTRFPLGLEVIRSVEAAPNGRPGFMIRFNLSVPSSSSDGVRLGGFGFSLISDTFFGGTNNTQIAASGSFLDAHPGLNGGYATITRADGSRTLLVTPCSPNAGFEAWRPILEDPNPPNEGMWEWTIHSTAWASEWSANKQSPILDFPNDPAHAKAWPNPRSPWPSWHLHETVYLPNPRPWNPPTQLELSPGEEVSYALCFSLPPPVVLPGNDSEAGGEGGPRAINDGLIAAGQPVLLAVPGVIVGADNVNASLFVYPKSGETLSSASSDDPDLLTTGSPVSVGGGYIKIPIIVAPGAHGRARVVLTFSDGSIASAHYFALPSLQAHSVNYGEFAASTTWLPRDFQDSFGRSASFMPWDREEGVHVLQDGRPFVVGLSDDAGAGANLGMAAKLASGPHAGQVALLDEYVNATLLGVKPDTATPPLFSLQDPVTWRIFMTVWYFDKSPLNATGYYEETDKCTIGPSWCAFNSPWCNPEWCALPPGSGGWSPATYRQYNFPHQIATYWSLYLTSRNLVNIPTRQSYDFYLNAAVQSIYAANCLDPNSGRFDCLISVGLMDGTVFREVLRALKSEGPGPWAQHASMVESIMRNRTLQWNSEDNPAGSEFAWDTTGQEEVAVWGSYFNSTDNGWMHGSLNARTVGSILGYTQVLPTFAFSGSSYGMGDMSNNAKWMVTGGWEREGGHYRSGLNSIPVIERYRSFPDDFGLLRIGIAGLMSCLPNIDAKGAPSMAFHTHPFIMEHDPNSGDHGLAFFGHSLNAGLYLHNHPQLGPLCFMCDVEVNANGNLYIIPRDTYHIRAFLEPLGLWMVAEAGRIASISLPWPLSSSSGSVTIEFESSNSTAAMAGLSIAPYNSLRLRIEASAPDARPYSFSVNGASLVRGAFEITPNPNSGINTDVVIQWTKTA